MASQVVVSNPPQQPNSTAGTVVATVGCAALGLAVAGPVGAFLGGSVGALLSSSRSSSRSRRAAALGVTNIRIPRDGTCEHRGATYFAVEVTHNSGNTWRVMRRYSEFYKLKRRFGARVRYPFPRKHWFGCSALQLEARRQGLEAWLAYTALRYTNTAVPSWVEFHLHDFLERGASQTSPTVAVYGGLPTQQPDTMSVMVPEGVVAGQPLTVSNPDGFNFVVHVPQGARPGTVLQVRRPQTQVPDGRELTVEVPEGAGEELLLEFDPQAGELTALPPASSKDPGHSAEAAAVFSVPVPPEGRPGQMIHVQVPDGRKLPITLPEGKRPGELFLVSLDPAQDCLVLSQ
ncbi:Sorting nexin-22 [Symbiodinium microadriaticum]|uniref:Sorting nexin-22 n=1 Tax=Symbiodinium microadriaticum TaxID=2951 RepID=A0A1Q9E7Y9_SYMMI|nr:Sorting nexin-22 [Symbiodinium microadriaticum]